MKDNILSLDSAKAEVERFKATWDIVDDREVASGGTDTSIPPELTEILIVAFMRGEAELTDDGSTIVQHVRDLGEGIKELRYKPKITAHSLRELSGLEEVDQGLALAEICTGVPSGKLNNLSAREFKIMSSIGSHISFS